MFPRFPLILIILLGCLPGAIVQAAALSGNAKGNVVDVEPGSLEGGLISFEEDDDEESEFISDFELADTPDPELKKYKDPEFLTTEYKRGRMAFLFGQYDIAYKILLPLAENGYAKAQATVGWMFHIGKGKKKDLGKALDWYEKAAKQNHPVALNNIGVFYEQGLYVGKSIKSAAKWYKESAEWGYPFAQYNLGILYHEGRGVKKDPKEAQFWLQIAALQGVEQAVDTLKKISGKVHGGKNKSGKNSKDGKGPQWVSQHQQSDTKSGDTFNPHDSSQYKSIADQIRARRETTTSLDSGYDDFLKPPPTKIKPKKKAQPKPKNKAKKAAPKTASKSPKLSREKVKAKTTGKRVEGQFKSGEQFDKWLSDAQVAQQRLEQQKKQKKKTNSHTLEIFNDDWVNARNKKHYTIQLTRSDKLDWLLKMARKQPMLKETAYYTSLEDGKKWYNLVYGNFKNKKAATAEINNLPKTVKQWSPRVRSFSDVQSNMSLDAPKTVLKKN